MNLFSEKQVLVCTDVAGMGLDIRDLDFSLNLGTIDIVESCINLAFIRNSQELLETTAAKWSHREDGKGCNKHHSCISSER